MIFCSYKNELLVVCQMNSLPYFYEIGFEEVGNSLKIQLVFIIAQILAKHFYSTYFWRQIQLLFKFSKLLHFTLPICTVGGNLIYVFNSPDCCKNILTIFAFGRNSINVFNSSDCCKHLWIRRKQRCRYQVTILKLFMQWKKHSKQIFKEMQ